MGKRMGLTMRIAFRPPFGEIINEPALEMLHDVIVSPPAGYWDQGSGGGTLDCSTDGSKTSLMLFPDSRYGVYLRFYDEQENPWLSLEDKAKLLEVTECNDEWYASVGLFLPKEKAWLAVKEFCLTGRRSLAVQWIPASEIPEGGNW
jgi:hypothetical protein